MASPDCNLDCGPHHCYLRMGHLSEHQCKCGYFWPKTLVDQPSASIAPGSASIGPQWPNREGNPSASISLTVDEARVLFSALSTWEPLTIDNSIVALFDSLQAKLEKFLVDNSEPRE